jgi:NAD(P)-dependent dehydrogenase (short-subunit alcohol dehydrogenase family)
MMFDLTGRTVLITGGCGQLGMQHAEAILEFGGEVVLADIVSEEEQEKVVTHLKQKYDDPIWKPEISSVYMDVTDKVSIQKAVDKYVKIDVLINNAGIDPKVEEGLDWKNKFEYLELDSWNKMLEVTLTGTFLCSQVVVNKMLSTGLESEYCRNGGIILNIASDLAIISPDQRIYKDENKVKPVSYGVAKAGVVNLTKYMATYFARKNIRVNSISPAGVKNEKVSEDFSYEISKLIPMNRMALPHEFKGAVAFLCSEASSFVNGHNLVIDGGRTVW